MLLDKILLSLKKGNIVTYDDLAVRMDVDTGVVSEAIGQLYRMGYLERYGTAGSTYGNCSGCKASCKKRQLLPYREH